MIILNIGPNSLVSYSISKNRIQMKNDMTTRKMFILKSELELLKGSILSITWNT